MMNIAIKPTVMTDNIFNEQKKMSYEPKLWYYNKEIFGGIKK
jgi:hypothetical protein